MNTRTTRSGAALIEALVAIAIFGTAAVGWMLLARQSGRTVVAFGAHDRLIREADSALAFAAAAPPDSLFAFATGRQFGRVVVRSREIAGGLVRLDVASEDGLALLSTIVLPERGGE